MLEAVTTKIYYHYKLCNVLIKSTITQLSFTPTAALLYQNLSTNSQFCLSLYRFFFILSISVVSFLSIYVAQTRVRTQRSDSSSHKFQDLRVWNRVLIRVCQDLANKCVLQHKRMYITTCISISRLINVIKLN